MEYYKLSVEETMEKLETSRSGVTKEEAAKRIEQYGYNEIAEGKRDGVLTVFLKQFADLLVFILIICAVLSALTGNAESTAVIIGVIVMNAIIGTVQHFKAEKSLDALRAMSSPLARVVRRGEVCEIPAKEVVVGDMLLLEAGSVAAADGRVIESAGLMANESSLTGESNSIEKNTDAISADGEVMLGDRVNTIYSGSLITAGRGAIIVTETGMNTEIGKIATMINKAEAKKTPLQKSLDTFSRNLSIAILIICVIVMGLSIARGQELLDAMMFAVALAVAAIPEALSSIVTISLAIGTRKMAEENAVIKDLKAVEGLGCVSIICSDKTGTLTKNKMTVREVFYDGENHIGRNSINEKLDMAMCLCCDAVFSHEGTIGDPTETALIEYCQKDKTDEIRNAYKRISEIPFDSDRKLMSTLHIIGNKSVMFTKGATDNVLPRLEKILDKGVIRDITDDDRHRIEFQNDEYSNKGMRVLCFCLKEFDGKSQLSIDDENNFVFIGLCAMTDPPRDESKAAVADCLRAGIKPIMITGDHKVTATAIAKEIGIFREGDIALDGMELETLSDNELIQLLPKVSVYARVNPSHKIRIVTLWQDLGNVVAMTGDGVNDAPALKKADVGVAMGITGTEVSKDAATMILTDDNFATIIKSVANGRSIYANIKNSIRFLLTGNLAGILTVLYTVIRGLASPFTAVQLLFINLLTDSLPAIAISMEKPDGNLLDDKPRKSDAGIMDKKFLTETLVIGLLITIATVIAYHIGLDKSAVCASTMAFSTLCLARLFHCFNCRGRKPVNVLGFTSNSFSLVAFFAGILFLAIALFVTPLHSIFGVTALTGKMLGMLLILAVSPTILVQIWKNIVYFKNKK